MSPSRPTVSRSAARSSPAFAVLGALVFVALSGVTARVAVGQGACAGAVTQGEINDCMALSWRRADADLNRAYAAAMAAMRRADTVAMEGRMPRRPSFAPRSAPGFPIAMPPALRKGS